MIMAVCKPNEKIIVPRNGHKSVMDGIILSGANPVFIQPEVDYHFGISHGVSVENVDNAIKAHPDAKALLITYPTYFGTMTDLTKICTIAHEHDITVIVDSAHGAHLNFVEMVDPISEIGRASCRERDYVLEDEVVRKEKRKEEKRNNLE